ncbi:MULTISPECIES: hypothetical protein [Sphingobium]|uniref:hypothetical protein n=1 Tax=Sphingobium TaxID=165695 RepID=UPI001BEA9AA5|nr:MULTISPECIES: hypothetical protein [Sphingobium]MBT2246816.1 hypothetical protein [Sphingobium sp. BHU LFT2]WBQ18996.1 hypothetical protein PAE53_24435 [Sphingobium yanoikuyae]
MPVTGWKLDPKERAQLLERFPPIWPDVIADHVPLKAGASANEPLPVQAAAEIVGSVDDGEGLQALIVSIDGSTYHITWSLDQSRGRKAVQSNDVITERGWEPLPAPVPIPIEPARF